jgi:competence protein ComEA
VDGEVPRPDFATRLQALRSDRRVVGALFACVAIAAGFAWWRAGASASLPASPPPTTAEHAERVATTTTTSSRIVVHVVGAVARSGVLQLRSGARVIDAIEAAGGAGPDADLARLNLAAPVSDGERIAVPTRDGSTPPLDGGATSGPAVRGGPPTPAAPLNVNNATAEQLDELPGVGPATAAAIVSDREANGPFASVDDLGRVRGIGPAKLEQLRELVVV